MPGLDQIGDGEQHRQPAEHQRAGDQPRGEVGPLNLIAAEVGDVAQQRAKKQGTVPASSVACSGPGTWRETLWVVSVVRWVITVTRLSSSLRIGPAQHDGLAARVALTVLKRIASLAC